MAGAAFVPSCALIRASHINQGYATEVAVALTTVAFRVHGVSRVEMHCNPASLRRAAAPRQLAFIGCVFGRRRPTLRSLPRPRSPVADYLTGALNDLMV
jgi:hypothetical protein